MKKFVFSLQRVLDYRTMIEDTLLAQLAVIQAEYERETRRLSGMIYERESIRNMMRQLLLEGDPENIKQANEYLLELINRVINQEVVVQQVIVRKDQKVAEVLEATKDRKALEKLRDYKKAEYRQGVEKEEQKFLDEVGVLQRSRKMRDGLTVGGWV